MLCSAQDSRSQRIKLGRVPSRRQSLSVEVKLVTNLFALKQKSGIFSLSCKYVGHCTNSFWRASVCLFSSQGWHKDALKKLLVLRPELFQLRENIPVVCCSLQWGRCLCTFRPHQHFRLNCGQDWLCKRYGSVGLFYKHSKTSLYFLRQACYQLPQYVPSDARSIKHTSNIMQSLYTASAVIRYSTNYKQAHKYVPMKARLSSQSNCCIEGTIVKLINKFNMNQNRSAARK